MNISNMNLFFCVLSRDSYLSYEISMIETYCTATIYLSMISIILFLISAH